MFITKYVIITHKTIELATRRMGGKWMYSS